MNNKNVGAPASGLDLREILYIVFRHKWMIGLVSLAAIAAAASLPFVHPMPFQSEAKLYIKYVLERDRSETQLGGTDTQVKSPDERGENILNSELEILTSFDLAQQVVGVIGPERILATEGGGTNSVRAAAAICRNLTTEVPRRTSVVRIVFHDRDPALVQPVLRQLIEAYLKRHVQVHQEVGVFNDFLTREVDQRRAELAQTEEELRKAKERAHIFSLPDQKQACTAAITRLQQEIIDAQCDLAEHRAAAEEIARSLHVETPALTNDASRSQRVATVSPEVVSEYRSVCDLTDTLLRREQEMLLTYTPASSMVRALKEQLAAAQESKTKLETENPGLLQAPPSAPSSGTPLTQGTDQGATLAMEMSRVSGLQARIETMKEELQKTREQAASLENVEGPIMELQRKLTLDETNYSRFSQTLEQSRVDEKIAEAKDLNISIIQEPSPPFRDNIKLIEAMAGVLFGGIAAAFGLAFVLEIYVDRSVKRPREIETKLRLPLFMSIPMLNGNGKHRELGGGARRKLLAAASSEAGEGPDSEANGDGPGGSGLGGHPGGIVAWDAYPGLRPFSDALRDRLLTDFELRNMTHKPKLVAVTGCGEGAGASTIAAGLAASLSETGEGNVLLVNMNIENGGTAHFQRGGLAYGLDEALESDKREQAQVQNKLYMVSEAGNGSNLPAALPKRFQNLVPRLRASDYDYIIFDMPRLTRISITPRLARFMDKVLMVVESEKTDGEVAKRANALLVESKADVGIVLNKVRSYLPKRLRQEL